MGYVLQLIILENELLKDIIINISIILRRKKNTFVMRSTTPTILWFWVWWLLSLLSLLMLAAEVVN